MMGKDLWEDLDIDSLHYESELKHAAQQLIIEYGRNLKETDILRLKALQDSQSDPLKRVLAIYALEYYMTTDYAPKRESVNTFPRRKWWKFW